jgi:hypothetical protein
LFEPVNGDFHLENRFVNYLQFCDSITQ